MAARECPLCASDMRLVTRNVTTQTPGTPETRTSTYDEWVCPDCDYFEEVDKLEG